MLRFSIAAGAVAICLAMPAAAQNSMSGPSSMSSAPAATGMTCDQMMAQADRMSTSSTGARMTMAQNERHLATQAKAKNDEAGCQMHMTKAMQMMK
jgi:hypothetical protein